MIQDNTHDTEDGLLMAVIGWITSFWVNIQWFAAEAGKAAIFGFIGAIGAITARVIYKKWLRKFFEHEKDK